MTMGDKRFLVGMAGLVWAGIACADDAGRTREEMQRALNQQVMAVPFNPGDIKKAQGYAEQAKKDGVVPAQQPPAYWQPGWTCGSLVGYAYYNYGDYRNCVYYNHYYGRYWR